MKIDSSPKKYPINEKVSPIKRIYLYDYEGIEKAINDGKEINSHFFKVQDFFNNNENTKSALRYCKNWNSLERDENYIYIYKMINLYQGKKTSIFIYAKTNSIKEEEINMEKGLKGFNYFKYFPNEFIFK